LKKSYFLLSQLAIVANSACLVPKSFFRIIKGKTANHSEDPTRIISQERLSVFAVEESLKKALTNMPAVKRLPMM
jgi:hypothetical protein